MKHKRSGYGSKRRGGGAKKGPKKNKRGKR